MNHETKEQAALGYLQKFERTDAYSPRHMEKAFIAGATWREQQAASDKDNELFNQLISEWSEKYKQLFVENDDEFLGHTALHFFKKAWQASALNSAKLLAEKDAEIERLKEDIDALCVSLDFIAENTKGKVHEYARETVSIQRLGPEKWLQKQN